MMSFSDGLQGYYKFDLNVDDSSAANRDGAAVGSPEYIEINWLGREGGAIRCEPSNAFEIPWAVFADLANFSIAWHVQPVDAGQSRIVLLDGANISVIALLSQTTIRLGAASPIIGPPLPASVFDPAVVSSVVVTRTITNGQGVLQVSVNGELLAGYGVACSAANLPGSGGSVRVSGLKTPAGPSDYTSADWSELAVWSRVLRRQELRHEAAYGLLDDLSSSPLQRASEVDVLSVRPDIRSDRDLDDSALLADERPIAVDQPTGGGEFYPFIERTSYYGLVADLQLSYLDDTCIYALPFRLTRLFGGGPLLVDDPEEISHAVDAIIKDADGTTVLDTRESSFFRQDAFGGSLEIYTWATTSAQWVLRIVLHKAQNLEPPLLFSQEINDEDSWLDMRACERRILHVRTLRIEGYAAVSVPLILRNGYNTSWEVGETELTGGIRPTTELILHAGAGEGLGRFPTDCDEDARVLRTINGIGPDASGNLVLDADGCHRVSQAVASEIGSAVVLAPNTVSLASDCYSCCTCDDYINSYEAIRRLRDRYAALVVRAHAVRDQYIENVARFAEAAARRVRDLLRMGAQAICPDEVEVVISFCNTTGQCLEGLIIPFSFEYLDAAGIVDPLTGLVYKADTHYSGDPPEMLANTILREGNADCAMAAGSIAAGRQFYQLGGDYPHFFAAWEKVDPGVLATLHFRVRFTNSESGDRVEIVADAYSVGAGVAVPIGGDTFVNPIPGYVFGSGPTAPSLPLRLVDAPRKISVGLLQDC